MIIKPTHIFRYKDYLLDYFTNFSNYLHIDSRVALTQSTHIGNIAKVMGYIIDNTRLFKVKYTYYFGSTDYLIIFLHVSFIFLELKYI